ncbi:EF-hand calcium-binding domain-containing protein 12 isoform X2 [Mixophyes fleayi]|uniref:EF-hand calcium-binding domain-containing protein 12 isoform X2 n=1 Tax=Mixophyes fleayi TaxID=3061075 RepID=UPI003F4DD33C
MQNLTMAKDVSFQDVQPSMDNHLKGYKQRDLSQTLFFKVASRTFGPPKSRTRRINAPPMEKLESGTLDVKEESLVASRSIVKSESDRTAVTEETSDTGLNISDWILERKKFREQLDSMGDIEKWLQGKPDWTDLETRVQDRMAERRIKSQMSEETTVDTVYEYKKGEHSKTRSAQPHVITPTIQQPNPEALAILQRYLNQRRLRLVDLYNQTDKSKRNQISSHDLKTVRQEADIPISDLQFDDLVISLGSKQPNYINYKELSVGRHLWRKKTMEDRKKGVAVSPATVPYFQTPSNQTTGCGDTQLEVTLSGSLDGFASTKRNSRPVHSVESGGSGSQFLQVPPVSLEEMRPLSYEDMEEIGKHYRERKRRVKSNTRLLDWLEQCRLVRSGNAAVDAHSLPSTLGGEAADVVEKCRRQGLQQYYKILNLCRAYKVPLTEKLLERGDKLVTCESGQQLPLRQPGTLIRSKDERKSAASRKYPQETGKTQAERSPERGGVRSVKSDSVAGIRDGPYPPEAYVRWVKTKVRGKKKVTKETLRCWTTYEQFQGMIGHLKRRFPHSFYTSDDNAFWPGHLVEKLRIYLPKAAETTTSQSLTRSCVNQRG